MSGPIRSGSGQQMSNVIMLLMVSSVVLLLVAEFSWLAHCIVIVCEKKARKSLGVCLLIWLQFAHDIIEAAPVTS